MSAYDDVGYLAAIGASLADGNAWDEPAESGEADDEPKRRKRRARRRRSSCRLCEIGTCRWHERST